MSRALDIAYQVFVFANAALWVAIVGGVLVAVCLEVTEERREWRELVRWSRRGGAVYFTSLRFSGYSLVSANQLDGYEIREARHSRFPGVVREAEILNGLWREEWAGDRLRLREELIDGEWVATFPEEVAA